MNTTLLLCIVALVGRADSITRTLDHLFDWADRLDPMHVSFLLKSILLFGLPTLFCSIAFLRGSRNAAIQVLCMVLGVMLASTIPTATVAAAITNRTVKAWLIVFSAVLLLFLPAVLPKLLVPQLGPQRKLQALSYVLLLILFIANLFCARSS